jgi:transcription-repair coupling factor (superfamily II helicase)
MESDRPMDRLVCGDVGLVKRKLPFGLLLKLWITAQVAILVPTTILAYQHYRTGAIKDMPVTIGYLNRFRTAKQKETIKDLAEED